MFKESFGFPWDSLKLSEEYKKLPLEERIEYLCHKIFGKNPDKDNPAFKDFNIAIEMIREGLKEREDQS